MVRLVVDLGMVMSDLSNRLCTYLYQSRKVAIVWLLCIGVPLVIAYFGHQHLVGMNSTPEIEIVKCDNTTLALTSVDQEVSMLTNIQFGLFVLLGVGLQVTFKNQNSLDFDQKIAGLIFMVTAFMSLFLGYNARIQMIHSVDQVCNQIGYVAITIENEAIVLTFSAMATAIMLVRAYFK